MDVTNGLIDRWADEAASELGEKGWREVEPNSLMLIIYSMQRTESRRVASRITRPFWWLLAVVAPGVIWYIVSGVIGLRI